MTLYERAEVRVRQMFASDTPEDRWAREFALTDWPEGDEHWAWLAGASASEVRDWIGETPSAEDRPDLYEAGGGTTRAGCYFAPGSSRTRREGVSGA